MDELEKQLLLSGQLNHIMLANRTTPEMPVFTKEDFLLAGDKPPTKTITPGKTKYPSIDDAVVAAFEMKRIMSKGGSLTLSGETHKLLPEIIDAYNEVFAGAEGSLTNYSSVMKNPEALAKCKEFMSKIDEIRDVNDLNLMMFHDNKVREQIRAGTWEGDKINQFRDFIDTLDGIGTLGKMGIVTSKEIEILKRDAADLGLTLEINKEGENKLELFVRDPKDGNNSYFHIRTDKIEEEAAKPKAKLKIAESKTMPNIDELATKVIPEEEEEPKIEIKKQKLIILDGEEPKKKPEPQTTKPAKPPIDPCEIADEKWANFNSFATELANNEDGFTEKDMQLLDKAASHINKEAGTDLIRKLEHGSNVNYYLSTCFHGKKDIDLKIDR